MQAAEETMVSWDGAKIFYRAWIPAVLSFVVFFVVAFHLPPAMSGVVTITLALLHGVSGNDMLGWALERRGYLLTNIITARTEADALARLLTVRPDLAEPLAGL